MAAPFAHEDLEKFKKFIEFVSTNPMILNLPQLEFVRKFIEQFGGTIPAGEFQMPAGGGKCPFGGDAKYEPKSAPPPDQQEASEDMAEDDESAESEVELDMEETNVQLLEPNVLYLDEKPPKIVKSKKPPKKAERIKKISKKRTSIKKEQPPLVSKAKKTRPSTGVVTVKKELHEVHNETDEQSGDDPLYMPHVEVKMEIEVEDRELILDKKPLVDCTPNAYSAFTDDNDLEKGEDDNFSVDDDDDDEYEAKFERELDDDEDEDIVTDEEDGDTDEEDEPLIMLAKRRGRPRKYPARDEIKVKIPRLVQCRDICKQHCTQKFTEVQRKRMCDNFWSLPKENRVQFIRKHTKAKRYTRLKRKKPAIRGSNCCYYLDDESSESAEMIRVCRKYFEATLCVTSHTIKKTLLGYEPEPEKEIKPLTQQEREERKNALANKPKEIRQILDPETGNLVTIDPNAKKKLETSSSMPKKKRIRRKPGDPQPEHHPKPIKCEQRCIYKCQLKFTEEERKQICDLFWSLDYKRRKDFVLARIETKEVETEVTPEFRKSNRPPRAYHTRFFLRSGLNGENKRVCKHFMMSTLCINRNFITNAIEFADKNTGYYTGVDRRGRNSASNKVDPVRRQVILDHINSYLTWVPNKKSKTRYLHHKLTIKQMYMDYKDMCIAQQKNYVSSHYYYKSFHDDFRLSFLCNPEPKRGGGFMNLNPNISHYTGDESGGFWLNTKGEKLDINSMPDPTQSTIRFPRLRQEATPPAVVAASSTVAPLCTSNASPTFCVGSSSTTTPSFNLNQQLSYAHFIDPSSLAMLTSGGICHQPPSTVVRQEYDPNLYDSNIVQAHATSSTVFRRL